MNLLEQDMLTYKDKVALHNAQNAIQRHLYCHSYTALPIEKIIWEPKSYLDYIKHLSKHLLQINTVHPVYLKATTMTQTWPSHLQCDVCGAISPMETEDLDKRYSNDSLTPLKRKRT